MIGMILIELLSLVSFIYSLILMYISFAPINEIFLIFLWTIIISVIFALSYKKSIVFESIILLLLLPLKLYNSKSAIFLIVLTAYIIYIYVKKSLFKVNYYEYVDKVKKTYLIYIASISLRYMFGEFSGTVGYSLPFTIIYLLSSIVLTRLMRHLDFDRDIKKIRKSNIKYLAITGVVFILVTFDGLRKNIVNFLEELLLAIYYPIYLLFRNFRVPQVFRKTLEENNYNDTNKLMVNELPLEESGTAVESNLYYGAEIFSKVMIILIILALVYIIYKLFIRNEDREYDILDYIEEREDIKEEKKKKKRYRKEKYPSELKNQIRYYYRRYLERVKKEKIEILQTDTSQEVNKKAKEIFEDNIDRIRNIYIDSRYGNKEVDKAMVEEMENLYKNLIK